MLAERLVPYLQLVVVPLLARMSDPLPPVRTTAAPAFAAIVALVPLAQVRLRVSRNTLLPRSICQWVLWYSSSLDLAITP